jgi:hypothetical protein
LSSGSARFAEVRVDADSGEVRVPRMLGVFAVGRVMNAKTARSQLLGGMAWKLSMALLEESVLDPRYGDYANTTLPSTTSPSMPMSARSTRTTATSARWVPREWGRSGSSARRRGRERRAPRNRRARARLADHARQAADVLKT